jgi:hypothetical protein
MEFGKIYIYGYFCSIHALGESKCHMNNASIAKRKASTPLESDDYFGNEFTNQDALGDPKPILAFLAQSIIETLAGIRDIEQCARWLSDGVYQQLRQKSLASTRSRAESNVRALRPNLAVGKISVFSPRAGVIEGVVIVHNIGRARAVAIRLEGYNGRWRARSVAVL